MIVEENDNPLTNEQVKELTKLIKYKTLKKHKSVLKITHSVWKENKDE